MHECCCDERGGDERFAAKFVFVFIVFINNIIIIDEIFFFPWNEDEFDE